MMFEEAGAKLSSTGISGRVNHEQTLFYYLPSQHPVLKLLEKNKQSEKCEIYSFISCPFHLGAIKFEKEDKNFCSC